MAKFTINVDENNFILSIAHTADDNAEIDLDSIEPRYLNAYQYINNSIVLNEARKEELIEEEERQERTPAPGERLEAQVFYTAMMTDTLLEEDE